MTSSGFAVPGKNRDFSMQNSVRFFPHWAPHDPRQVIGFLRLVGTIQANLGHIDHWVEVGGYLGESATLARGMTIMRLDIIEASEPHVRKLRLRFAGMAGINITHARSVDAAAKYADGSVDVVYIDADHSYEAVAADIDAWLPKIRPGGFIAGHDYHDGFPGVKQAVDERLSLWATFCDSSWIARVT